MPALGSIIKQASRGADLYFVFRFLRLLTMKWERTDAYKYGIIDKKGNPLKRSSELETVNEKAAYTMLHRMVFKIRKLIEKVPLLGKSILLNYAAALFLLKEQKDPRVWTDDGYMKQKLMEFLETDWEADAKFLKEEVDNMDKKTFQSFLREDINEGVVLDVKDVDKWIPEIKKGIKAGWVSVGKSTLGGDENVAIMIKLTLEPEKDWPNKILQNASYGMIRIATDGTMEMFASDRRVKNMRKTKIKSAKDVVSKINTWIKTVSEEVEINEEVFNWYIIKGNTEKGKVAHVGTERQLKLKIRKPTFPDNHVLLKSRKDLKIGDNWKGSMGISEEVEILKFKSFINEKVELDEEFSEKDFDSLKKGDTITIEFKSPMSTGKATFKVTAKNIVGKAKVHKATLQNVKNPKSVKFFLYKRGNKVSLAQGDMAASVVKYTVEEVELDEAAPPPQMKSTDQLKFYDKLKTGDTFKVWYQSTSAKGDVWREFKVTGKTPEKITLQSLDHPNKKTAKFYLYNRGKFVSWGMNDKTINVTSMKEEVELDEMPNRANIEKVNSLIKKHSGKFKWRDEVLYVDKGIEKDVTSLIKKGGLTATVKVSSNPMKEEVVVEREMTDSEKEEREEIVKKLKPKLQSFKDKYGDDAEKVMYATATKQAMEEFKLDEGWKKGKYKVTDGKRGGKILGTFSSGGKAQKFVDDLFQKGDYEKLTVELIDEAVEQDQKLIDEAGDMCSIPKHKLSSKSMKDTWEKKCGGKTKKKEKDSPIRKAAKRAGMDRDQRDALYNEVEEEGEPTNNAGSGAIAGLDSGLTYKKKKEDVKKAKTLRKQVVGESVKQSIFAGKDVFIVDSETYYTCRLGKKRYARYEKYVGNGKIGQAIREYGLKYPKRPIILQNGESGPMLYLKYGKG